MTATVTSLRAEDLDALASVLRGLAPSSLDPAALLAAAAALDASAHGRADARPTGTVPGDAGAAQRRADA